MYLYRFCENAVSHITFTELRHRMASYFDQGTDNREPLVVTRQGGKGSVVIMSEAEFAGWQETVHLLSSPKNATLLMESIRQARSGETRERGLLSPDKSSA